MPLDVLGRTRATLTHATSPPCPKGLGNLVNVCRDRDRLLQLLILNEEFLVNAGHQLALITSLPFVPSAIVLSQEKQLRSSYGIKAILLQRDLQM